MLDRDAIIAAARAKRAEIAAAVTERDELRARLEESAGTLRTVANLFSNSVWAILPAKIKAYFAEYRG